MSLAASQLSVLEDSVDPARLRKEVEEAYRHKNYSAREKLLGYAVGHPEEAGEILRRHQPTITKAEVAR